jgi:K+ transporter
MGLFGEHPIRAAWFALVLPALVNGVRQGALLLPDLEAAHQPFWRTIAATKCPTIP